MSKRKTSYCPSLWTSDVQINTSSILKKSTWRRLRRFLACRASCWESGRESHRYSRMDSTILVCETFVSSSFRRDGKDRVDKSCLCETEVVSCVFDAVNGLFLEHVFLSICRTPWSELCRSPSDFTSYHWWRTVHRCWKSITVLDFAGTTLTFLESSVKTLSWLIGVLTGYVIPYHPLLFLARRSERGSLLLTTFTAKLTNIFLRESALRVLIRRPVVRRGSRKMTPEKNERAQEVHGLESRPPFHAEREEKKEICGGWRGKKSA